MTLGEKRLCNFQYSKNGDFFRKLFNAAFSADLDNLMKLKKGFPEEIGAVIRYKTESSYWDELEKEYLRNR